MLEHDARATVYLAHELKHDNPVALKVLHPELAASLGPDRFHVAPSEVVKEISSKL